MTLTTHAIVGAAVAELFPSNPAAAFIAAFLSHLAIDAIPHWDYKLHSYRRDPNDPLNGDMVLGKDFWIDIAKISFDFFLGIFLSLILFSHLDQPTQNSAIVILGAIGGMLPDACQFAYWKLRVEPFKILQKFHSKFIQRKHLSSPAGISWQVLLVIVVVIGIKLILHQ